MWLSLSSIINFVLDYGFALLVLVILVGFCVASGMYVFSLFVEERPSHAKMIVKILVVGSLLQTILCLRFIPWYVVWINIIGHIIYLMVSNEIPYINYTSPIFFAGCVTAVSSHLAFAIHFILSPHWEFWRLLLVNIYTLWTVPLLLVCSAVTAPEALVGAGEDENVHRSLFARMLKKLFGKAAAFVEKMN
ncbi:hypothetical protein EIN_344860 [Entamoeba invadens IP1]|uniref:Protein TEX261 n=1 Tax=Entamoeba invadens IP1 TaxID=370355 RepID=A0A0A1U3A7_ENTIV|nr:hypothetical protein EIN_344860 [Entamoeba invadens IP1]ELP88526.1 hypothetical protein EIN_344860 [Entamoeba invadens IP1]|eukprot:XP_004255297.1 hypothetical protein EIN_344860 [Entamoeba invadens IP1]